MLNKYDILLISIPAVLSTGIILSYFYGTPIYISMQKTGTVAAAIMLYLLFFDPPKRPELTAHQ